MLKVIDFVACAYIDVAAAVAITVHVPEELELVENVNTPEETAHDVVPPDFAE
jgi:hypothetical protein